MPASSRCTSFNLLNHCKQVNKPTKLNYEFILRNDYNGPEIKDNEYFKFKDSWICKFQLDNNIYYDCSYSKKKTLENILISLEEDLRSYL